MPSAREGTEPDAAQTRVVEVVVPGSAMLMGEHAVLRGHSSLVCALNRFIRVRGALTVDRRLCVRSSLGEYNEPLEALVDCADFRFVIAVIKRWCSKFNGGVDILIEADFSHEVGFGSSAAVTVAIELVCRQLLQESTELVDVLPAAVSVVRAVQGCGSGADVAASLFGGVVAYDPEAQRVTPIVSAMPVSFWYCGYKTPTPTVIRYVAEREKHYPRLYLKLFEAMGMVTSLAQNALASGDWNEVGQLMDVYQGLMESVGVSDDRLGSMVMSLRKCPGVCGAKISGSGLGDCVVSLHKSVSARPVSCDTVGQLLEASVSSVGAALNAACVNVS